LHVDEIAVQVWGSLLGVLKMHEEPGVARSGVRMANVNPRLLDAIDLIVDSLRA
jgi:hypothetical protein